MHRAWSWSSLAKPSKDGCRPIWSFTFLSELVGSLSIGRSLAYSGSANGTTVLSPSLPPVSCTTTRIVSLAPGLPAVGAANAVRLMKVGTLRPQATRLADFRNSRRVPYMAVSFVLKKIILLRFCAATFGRFFRGGQCGHHAT